MILFQYPTQGRVQVRFFFFMKNQSPIKLDKKVMTREIFDLKNLDEHLTSSSIIIFNISFIKTIEIIE